MRESNLDYNPPTASSHFSLRSEWAPKLDLSFLPPKLREEVIWTLERGLKQLEKINWPIRAVVWGGGFKQGEVVYTQDKLISDIDLYLFSNFAPFFWKKISKANEEMNQENPISFHFHGVIPFLLSKSRTYWAYRLKQQGIVLRGDKKILEKIQATSDNIPKIEAIRILFWNLAFWLSPPPNPNRILRSYLNLGESYLTFARNLAPTFRERAVKIDEIAEQLNLDNELVKRINLGYKARTGPLEIGLTEDLTLEKAKKDCLEAINHLLAFYLKTNTPLEEKLNFLSSKIPVKSLFNCFFYFSLRKIKEIRPKFFPIVFRFKITELWKIIVYNARGDYKKRDSLLTEYFSVKDFSDEALIKISEAYPSLSMMEIV